METRSRKRRDSDADSLASVSSEPAITRSRSTTPFTLRSQCTRHGSECPEGHGISFRNRLSPSPKGSNKKSPKKIVVGRNGSIRKNLASSLEVRCIKEKQGSFPIAAATPAKPISQTSDYSSGEEEKGGSNNEVCNTPTQASLKTTPLQRSAEKTDYTYAKSYSYRTEVTPERIIRMPNMTRRSIERCHGEGYSSPELKFSSSKTLFNSLTGKSTGLNTSYTNGFDSEQEFDENEIYKLKTPSASCNSTTFFFTRMAYSKLRGLTFSLAWWIYITTCYSLLIDTIVLQSRGVAKLRNFCRQQTKNSRSLLLLLFFFLPLCLCAGGLLYSALHAFSTRSADKPANTLVNPSLPQDLTPSLPPPLSPFSDSNPPDDSAWRDITFDLKLTKETLLTLQQKINNYDGKMSNMASQVDLLQGQLATARSDSKSCCDQTSPALLERLVEAKLGSLMSQLSQQAGLSLDDVGKSVTLLNEALFELKEVKKWKQSTGERNDKIAHELSQVQTRLDEKELFFVKKTAADIEEALKKWEADLKPVLIDHLKERILTELRHEIKVLDTKSGGGLSKDEVEQLIHSALGVYDSDKTGLADYALEPAGGVVLSTRCTETFSSHRPRLSIWGFSLWSEPNNPRVVIQPGIVPGQCWSFRGFDGYLVIQLSRKIVPTAFTLEHIPKRLAPDGQIDSAPRNFTVYGLTREADVSGVELGRYTYDSLGEPLQTFQVQAHDAGVFSVIELRIHSNHGNLNYTCLYRFRVHGKTA